MGIDKDKAIEELLNSMDDEFINGMRAMLHHIQRYGTECRGTDNCVICREGYKFLNQKIKEVKKNG